MRVYVLAAIEYTSTVPVGSRWDVSYRELRARLGTSSCV